MEFAILFLFVALIIVGAIYGAMEARKRRDAMGALAKRLGLHYHPERDPRLARQFEFLNRLAQGSNRYAYNILSGEYGGHEIKAFDFHYETYSTDSKGHRRTDHH